MPDEPAFPQVESESDSFHGGYEDSTSCVSKVYSTGGLSKRELLAAMAMQGMLANPKLQDEFWKNYESESQAIGPAEAAQAIELRIGYRAARVADATLLAVAALAKRPNTEETEGL